MRDVYSPSHGGTVSNIIKIEQGGHGGITAKEARDNLQVYGLEDIGKPNGLVPLKNGSIPSELLNPALVSSDGIYGPDSVAVNTKTLYKVNNRDSFTDYKASCLHGSIEVTDEGLLYSSPSFQTTDTIEFSGKKYHINVSESSPRMNIESILVKEQDHDDFEIDIRLILSGIDSHSIGNFRLDIFAYDRFVGTRLSAYKDESAAAFIIPKGWINTFGSDAELSLFDNNQTLIAKQKLFITRPSSLKKNLWVQRINIDSTNTNNNFTSGSCIHFSEDGKRLIALSRFLSGGSYSPGQSPSELSLWELEDGVFQKKDSVTQTPRGGKIGTVSVSKDFTKLMVGDVDFATAELGTVPYIYCYSISGNKILNTASMNLLEEYPQGKTNHVGSIIKYIGSGSHIYVADIQTGFDAFSKNVVKVLNNPSASEITNNFTYIPNFQSTMRTYPAVTLSSKATEFPATELYPVNALSHSGGKINIDGTDDGSYFFVNSPRRSEVPSPTWTDDMGIMELFKRDSNGTYSFVKAGWTMRNSEVPVENHGTTGDGIACFSNAVVRPWIGRKDSTDIDPFKGQGCSRENGRLFLEVYYFENGFEQPNIMGELLRLDVHYPEIPRTCWVTVVGKNYNERKVFFVCYNYVNDDLYVCSVRLTEQAVFHDFEILLKTNYSGNSDYGVTLDNVRFDNPRNLEVEVNEAQRLIAVSCKNKHYLDIFKY